MLVPSPKWLDTGDNAWQLAAATFVALQSIPGLTVLYGGVVKKKWAINSAFMSIYAFASVLVVWVLFDYNMAFGPQWFPFLGTPMPALSAAFSIGQATIPAAASGMPEIAFPMATLVYFQFVFAAITVIILAGSVLGRMSFRGMGDLLPGVDDVVLYRGGVQPVGRRMARQRWAWSTSPAATSSILPPRVRASSPRPWSARACNRTASISRPTAC